MQNSHTSPRPALSGIFVWILLIVFIVVTIAVGLTVFKTAHNIGASGAFNGPGLPDLIALPTDTPDPSLGPGEVLSGTLTAPQVVLEAKPWDGASRVTVLIVGLDYRDWEKGEGPARTDTMILLTIDPLTKTAGILNIPRDLWVNIPDYGYGRINTAYFLGEANKLPEGGPGLAVKTVEDFIGVPIDYFAQIDFQAFARFINSIGGIDIDVPVTINIDPIGQNNTITLKKGHRHLNGQVALAYARARYTEGSDFDRAQRQQQVIMAIRDKVLSVNMLPSLIAKSPVLYQQLASGVHTNLTLEQAIQLAWLAQQIPTENIKRGIIGPPDQVVMAKSPDGTQDVLKPISSKIRILRDEIFTSPYSPGANEDVASLLKDEKARLSVLNGSGVPGIAGQTSDYFKAQGMNVINTGDASQPYPYTSVVIYNPKPYTVSYLVKTMNIQPNMIKFEYNSSSEVDILVNLGSDWAASNPMK